jgi:hypothetical protein
MTGAPPMKDWRLAELLTGDGGKGISSVLGGFCPFWPTALGGVAINSG